MATIRKRGDKWQAMVRRAGAAPTSATFPSKAAAQTWARQTEGAIDRGAKVTTAAERRTTVADLLDHYVNELAGSRALSASNTAAVATLRRELGETRVVELAPKAIVGFGSRRRVAGVAPSTIEREISVLATIARHAGGLLEIDTARLAEVIRTGRALLSHSRVVGRSRERQRRPTEAELAGLFTYWRDHPRRVVPMEDLVRFALSTGMRLGEIVSLRWDDLDKDRRTIMIRDRKHPRQKEGNNQRVPLLRGPVVLFGEVVDPMAIIERQPRKGNELIFPYRRESVSVLFCTACTKCGVDDLTFHDMRHEATSRLFEASYAIEQVALVTGHRDWNMLRRYTQIRPESLHRPENVVPLARVEAA